jgi:hypothetical protein
MGNFCAKCGDGPCRSHFNIVCVWFGVREAGVTASEAMTSQAKVLLLLLICAAMLFPDDTTNKPIPT